MREEGPRSACRHGRQRADSFYTHVEVCSELQAHGGDCGEKKKKGKGKPVFSSDQSISEIQSIDLEID